MRGNDQTGIDSYPSVHNDAKGLGSPTDAADRGSSSSKSLSPSLLDRRYLIRRPRALQYFENGVLKKAQDKERVSGRFELFFDLLYVALIANFAEKLANEPSGVNLVLFLITFTAAWHAWADEKENANNYHNDDLVQRVGILWLMALLVLYGNNANFVGESLTSLRITVATYMVIRFTQATFFLYYSIASPHHRIQNRCYVISEIILILLLIPLYFEDVSDRAKIAIAFIALIMEELGYLLTFGPWIPRWLGLKFSTALDIDHENDRYTAFTIIVLGEFTYAILFGSPATGGLNLGLLRGVWTLVIAFCFNMMYTYEDGAISNVHPARRSVYTAFAWLLLHLPMSAGLLIAGHVSANATAEELTEGQRWLWGGGLAVGFLTFWVLSMLFKDMDSDGRLLIRKSLRVLPRLVSAVIIVLLPLATSEQLSDTGLLSIAAAVSAFTVVWETAGGLEKGACTFESWHDRDQMVIEQSGVQVAPSKE